MNDRATLNLDGAQCPCCRRPLARTRVSICRHCIAPHHATCVMYLGSCTTYGCSGTQFRYLGFVEGQVSVPKGDMLWEKPPEPVPIEPRGGQRRSAREPHEQRSGVPAGVVIWGIIVAFTVFGIANRPDPDSLPRSPKSIPWSYFRYTILQPQPTPAVEPFARSYPAENPILRHLNLSLHRCEFCLDSDRANDGVSCGSGSCARRTNAQHPVRDR